MVERGPNESPDEKLFKNRDECENAGFVMEFMIISVRSIHGSSNKKYFLPSNVCWK